MAGKATNGEATFGNGEEGIAILVPCYRCESTVEETLLSIQHQGDALSRVRAVYVADDGSNDATVEIARKCWSSTTPLVVIANTYNCGEYAQVNHAVDSFPADIAWFLIMHGDNVAKAGWLDTVLDAIDRAGDRTGSICTSYDYWDGSRVLGPGDERGVAARKIYQGLDAVVHTLVEGCWWHISACAIRVTSYRDVGGLPKIMQQKGDWDFSLRLLANGWAIEYLPVSTMLYRASEGGSSAISQRRHLDIYEALQVVSRFQRKLTIRKLLSVHGTYARFVVWRVGSSVVRGDWTRLCWAVPAGSAIGANLMSCLLERRARTPA